MASMASTNSRAMNGSPQRDAANRVVAKHLDQVKDRQRTWQERAQADHIRSAAKEAVDGGRIRSRDDYRQARDYYRAQRDQATAERNAATPSDYMDRYGSLGPEMYRRDQLNQQVRDKQTEARNAGVPDSYINRYGSQGAAVFKADELNRIKRSQAEEVLTPGPEKDRTQAMQESMRIAQSAGSGTRFYQAAQQGEGALRDAYRQEYAQWGNSPNVIGIKDVQELENRGYSGGDIRRIGLSVGSVGPKAKERIRMLTGQPM